VTTSDEDLPIEQDQRPEPGYEPPRLWEYGTLRVETVGAPMGSHNDAFLNLS
jgi:hypothetical protein